MTVHFIGAGPGAPDLITAARPRSDRALPGVSVRGIAGAGGVLAHCPPGARIVDTAPLSLDAIIAEIRRGP